jgi:hypothetical protein
MVMQKSIRLMARTSVTRKRSAKNGTKMVSLKWNPQRTKATEVVAARNRRGRHLPEIAMMARRRRAEAMAVMVIMEMAAGKLAAGLDRVARMALPRGGGRRRKGGGKGAKMRKTALLQRMALK